MQRFSNYRKALSKLEEAVATIGCNRDPKAADLLKEGLIQRFEFSQELAWKVMKDYLEYQGETNISGSRDAFRKSLAAGIISSPIWLDTIRTRNITSHTYDNEITDEVYETILTAYLPIMKAFESLMLKFAQNDDM